jgi:DHA1 family vesicular acetylcholine transporter-like MFS transporter 3
MQSTLSSSEEKFVVALPLPSPPIFLRLRSSTAVISLAGAVGLLVDLSGYGLIVPVIPFRLEELGYPITSVGSKVGWCVAAYAFGLILSTPGIAWAGERIQGRRGPLLVALLFMAGGEYRERSFVDVVADGPHCL